MQRSSETELWHDSHSCAVGLHQRDWHILSEVQLSEVMSRMAGKVSQQGVSGGLIYLRGEMGAGKSVAVRAFLRALGVQGRIKSPTYALVEHYRLKETTGALAAESLLTHWDLYRLSTPEELEYLAFRDCQADAALQLLEWPEKGVGHLPVPDVILNLSLLPVPKESSQDDRSTANGSKTTTDMRYLSATAFSQQGCGWLFD